MFTGFTRFVITPIPEAGPSLRYRAVITCTECDWSRETELSANEIQRLRCGGCDNAETAYLGVPDEFVGVPCPECARAVTRLEREADDMGRIERMRLFCPDCGWQL